MLRHLYLLALLASNLFACLILPVYGQEISLFSTQASPESASNKDNHALEGSALDLLITPRVSADYNSPQAGDSGVGYSRLNAFVPLFQTPGQTLTFLNTSARLDTQNNLGGNIALGHRFLVNDLLWGGYVAYDIRNTNLGTFSQLGTGLEVFGENWDAHLNGYIPVGNSTQTTGGSTVTGAAFQGSQLLLTIGGGTSQQAQGGADLDAGLRLTELGDLGVLWGYGGTYYYGNNFGGRLRLEQRAEAFQIGLGVDTGGLGTNVFVSAGVGWGGAPRNRATEEPAGVKQNTDEEAPTDANGTSNNGVNLGLWSRAANVVTRSNGVIIEQTTTAETTEVAVNPDTGQPYTFIFVTPDSVNVNQGDGSLSNPYTTLGTSGGAATTGLGAANANNVVYVRPGDTATNPITGGVTVPANVQLLSSGVTNSMSVSSSLGTTSVTLPDLGDLGTLPQIQNTAGDAVTLSNGATIAGFGISNTSGVGIIADLNGVGGYLTIRDNQISGTATTAIAIAEASNITIQNNQISSIQQTTAGTLTTTTSGNVNTLGAITLADVTGTVSLTGNSITNTTVGGTLSVLTYGQGISIANGTGTMSLTASGNTLTGNSNNGLAVGLVRPNATDSDAQGTISITDNTIQNNGGTTGGTRGDGIKIQLEEGSMVTSLDISGNTITGNQDDGIDVSLGQFEGTLSPSLIVGNSSARLSGAVIENNTVNSNVGEAIFFRTLGNDSRMSMTLQNNAIDDLTATTGTPTLVTAMGVTVTTGTISDGGNSRICLNVTGNTFNGNATLTARSSENFQLLGTSAVVLTTTQAQNLLNGNNIFTTGMTSATANTGSFESVTSCPTY